MSEHNLSEQSLSEQNLGERNLGEKNFEALMTRALEQRDEPAVPADFAARVRLALPALPAKRRRVSIGRSMAIAMAVLAAVVAFALASHTSASLKSLAFDIECALVLQTLGIAYWLGARQALR